MPQTIIDLLHKGAEANRADAFRKGNLISLPSEGRLVATGDIHGHRRNFEKITAFADLDNNPDTHIVLQEIIHGGPENSEGGCLSYELLFDAVRYKLNFPSQVHIIMGNHDAAYISNSKVMKNGKEMTRSMQSALDKQFQQSSADVKMAIKQFLFSQPLAVKCNNRIWMSHSLPDERSADEFAPQILDNQLKIEDCRRPGSAHLLIWGRKHSPPLLDKMARLFDVDIFILGHQPQQTGWKQTGQNLIIIASDHSHGCLLPIDLAKSYTIEQLIDSIVPLASLY
ncbi:MAG: metallophosphoesterase [Planctomycetota bacterium]|jgi:predicted phosphodiesterase